MAICLISRLLAVWLQCSNIPHVFLPPWETLNMGQCTYMYLYTNSWQKQQMLGLLSIHSAVYQHFGASVCRSFCDRISADILPSAAISARQSI